MLVIGAAELLGCAVGVLSWSEGLIIFIALIVFLPVVFGVVVTVKRREISGRDLRKPLIRVRRNGKDPL